MWLVAGGDTIHTLTHPNIVVDIAAENDLIVTACCDGKVRTWSLTSGALTRTLQGASMLWSVCLLGTMAVSGSYDGSIKVWSLDGDGECVTR